MFVGWVERSDTHRDAICDGFRKGSTHPTGCAHPATLAHRTDRLCSLVDVILGCGMVRSGGGYVMRSIFVFAIFAFGLIVTSSVHAADLENCGRFPEYQQKTDCLYKNEILLNSVLEVAVSELRKTVQELRTEITAMKVDIQTLKSSTPDLLNVVRFGGKVQLKSRQNFSGPGKCIDQRTNPDPVSRPDRVAAADCSAEDVQRWDVVR
jgi:hypothetical protein